MKKTIVYIELKSEVTSEDLIVIRSMYQPIAGIKSTSLYMSLLDMAKLSKGTINSNYDVSYLIRTLCTNETELLSARKALEALGLLRTFVRADDKAIIFTINKPLSPTNFLKNSFLTSQLKSRISEIDIERVVFGLGGGRKLSKDEYREETVKYQDIFSDEIKSQATTLEISVPKTINRDKAIISLTTAQFYKFLTGKRINGSKLFLFSSLNQSGFSSASINAIVAYAYDKNAKVVNKYVETIAEDLRRKGIKDFNEILSELKDAKDSVKRINKHKVDYEEIKQIDTTWEETFSKLGDDF